LFSSISGYPSTLAAKTFLTSHEIAAFEELKAANECINTSSTGHVLIKTTTSFNTYINNFASKHYLKLQLCSNI
jgi:hypothetical protein